MNSVHDDAPRPVRLGTWPTPLEPLPRLAEALGLGAENLWIKRDDLTGLGGGGNKIRKLEWLCGAALAEGATHLVTTGAPQSNHARLTAAAGARLGLETVVVLAGTPSAPVRGKTSPWTRCSAPPSYGPATSRARPSPPRPKRWPPGSGRTAPCRQ
ncbi:hypothetical protein GCM10010294_55540 [Streptomyces griseoloalbus]|nr:hypothetical protein GCM10010294_55540 [Streptomyces griseoloalbus]